MVLYSTYLHGYITHKHKKIIKQNSNAKQYETNAESTKEDMYVSTCAVTLVTTKYQ